MADLPMGDCWDGETWCEDCQQWHQPGPCEHEGPWWDWPDETITLGDAEPTEAELAEWEAEKAAEDAWDRACEARAEAWPMAWLTPGVN